MGINNDSAAYTGNTCYRPNNGSEIMRNLEHEYTIQTGGTSYIARQPFNRKIRAHTRV